MAVIKDAGERALLPPFTDEHEQLRETIARWVREEIAPHVDEWEEAREFPRELYDARGELGFLGLKYPTELGGQGGDYVHDAVWAEELAAAGRLAAGSAPGSAPTPGSRRRPIFKFGTPDQHERFLRPAIAGEQDRRARDHRAGRRLRRRLDPDRWPARSTAATSSTARRPSSPTASAPTSSSAP